MNKWLGIGRLCSDPEISTDRNGNPIAKYRLAVSRDFKREGQPEADFLTCRAYGKPAEFVQKYLHKGVKIAVEGRIQTGSYDKDGVRHYTTDIVVDRHEFCEPKGAELAENVHTPTAAETAQATMFPTYTPVVDEDLPF